MYCPNCSATARYSERTIPARRHHLLAQSFHSAYQSLPRLLRLLHLSPRPRPARRAHHVARRSRRGREAGRKAGMHRGAVLARRQARSSSFLRCAICCANAAIAARCTTSKAMCDLVLRETSLLPHSNPGLMSASLDRAPARHQSQPRSHARDHQRPHWCRREPLTTTLLTRFRRCA